MLLFHGRHHVGINGCALLIVSSHMHKSQQTIWLSAPAIMESRVLLHVAVCWQSGSGHDFPWHMLHIVQALMAAHS